jgi:hypothetical protein
MTTLGISGKAGGPNSGLVMLMPGKKAIDNADLGWFIESRLVQQSFKMS